MTDLKSKCSDMLESTVKVWTGHSPCRLCGVVRIVLEPIFVAALLLEMTRLRYFENFSQCGLQKRHRFRKRIHPGWLRPGEAFLRSAIGPTMTFIEHFNHRAGLEPNCLKTSKAKFDLSVTPAWTCSNPLRHYSLHCRPLG